MATIQELVDRRRKLVAQLEEVDAEIRSRHGEQPDEPEKPAKKTGGQKPSAPVMPRRPAPPPPPPPAKK